MKKENEKVVKAAGGGAVAGAGLVVLHGVLISAFIATLPVSGPLVGGAAVVGGGYLGLKHLINKNKKNKGPQG